MSLSVLVRSMLASVVLGVDACVSVAELKPPQVT
jgi:hypothetical protein